MRGFLEALGLSAGITRRDDWAAMHAGAGMVLLHSAASSEHEGPAGTTLLTGETSDVVALADRLGRRGLAATVVDEAYGRSLEVTDPLGGRVVVNETQTDTYGYEQKRPEPDPGVEVIVSRFTEPGGPYVGFVTALGLSPQGDWGEGYAAYGAGQGAIGLHHDDGSTGLGGPEPDLLVSLGLLTTWPLEIVQQRLSDAGFDPGRVVVADFGSRVETTDPDGQPLEIHQHQRPA